MEIWCPTCTLKITNLLDVSVLKLMPFYLENYSRNYFLEVFFRNVKLTPLFDPHKISLRQLPSVCRGT